MNRFKLKRSNINIQALLIILYLMISVVATRTIHGFAFIAFVVLTCKQVFKRNLLSLFKGNYIKVFIVFSAFVLASYFWADKIYLDRNIATVIALGLIEEIYIYLYFASMLRKKWSIDDLFLIYLIFAVAIGVYLLIFTPRSIWTDSNIRVGSNLNINRNLIGLIMAYASTISLYFSRKTSKKTKRLVYYLLILVMGTICLLTGSRKGALILVGGIVGYLIFSERNKKLIRNFGIAIGLLIVVYIVVMSNDALYSKIGIRFQYVITSIINDDTTVESSLNTRAFYRTAAISLWKNHPIIGAGLDGFSSYMARISYWHVAYSHNNYTEMLANYGIIGFLLYYVQRFIMIFRLRMKRYKNDKSICLLWICGLIMIVMEYACVTYYSLPVQLIFIFCALSTSNIQKKEKPISV